MKRVILLFVVFFGTASLCAAADVFTTTGSAGERVYTDKPLSGAQRVRLEAATSSDDESAQTQPPPFEELSRCEQARFVLKEYENASSLAEKTADGGTRVLSSEEAQAKIEEARADEQRLCEESDDE